MRAQSALPSRVPEYGSTPIELCTVRAGQALFGMPISHIIEIVGAVRPQPVPLASKFVAGLVHYRGDVLTTVSLRHLFGMNLPEGPQDALVLESSSGGFGVLVDAVGEVLSASAADFEPNPSTLDENRRDMFAGAYKVKGGLLVMLNPKWLDPMRLAAEQGA